MSKKPFIYDIDLPDLNEQLSTWNVPTFRSLQIWQGLYKQLWNTTEQFTMLPQSFRLQLAETYDFTHLQVMEDLQSTDGETHKILFQLPDGHPVEAVWMGYEKRNTLCISTQSGCAMGCVFCATGQMGFRRNLSSGEIVEQVMFYARRLAQAGKQVTNIVVMGMGEPFLNYEATLAAIDRLNAPDGFNLGTRRFTISTVGLVPFIRRFSNEHRQINLAVSLHAAEDELRTPLLPINRKYNLDELFDACREYVMKTNRRITFEYALIGGVNDTPEHARQLGRRISGLLCHVNIIQLNPTRGYPGKASSREHARSFQFELQKLNIPCTIRLRRGIDIHAGCGQLAGRN